MIAALAAAWSWFSGTKVGRFLIEAGVILAAIGAAALYIFEKGKHAQATTDEAKDAKVQAEVAKQVVEAAQTRQEVENETDKLPAAPAQTVATADPHTAAGELRDDGWVRADSGTD